MSDEQMTEEEIYDQLLKQTAILLNKGNLAHIIRSLSRLLGLSIRYVPEEIREMMLGASIAEIQYTFNRVDAMIKADSVIDKAKME